MKIIFLLSLIYSFVLANQSQIVLGTFSTESTAKKVKYSVNKIINRDIKFKNFLDKNSLKTVSKKHGKYFIVTIEPFSDVVTMHSVLNKIKKTKFKDAYVLKLGNKKTPKKEKQKAAVIKEPEIIDDPFLMPEPDIKSIKVKLLTQKDALSQEEHGKKDIEVKEKIIPKQTKKLNVFKTFIDEFIVAIIILTLIIIYFILKKSQLKMKDNLTDSTHTFNIEKVQEDSNKKTSLKEIKEGIQEPEQPIIMQEIPEAIPFDIFKEEDKVDIAKKEKFKNFAGKRILVAEDNIINQKIITSLLSNSGIGITMADDGQFLLEILEKDKNYHFILMNAYMPRVDGFEATRKIRMNPNYNHIVIIALNEDTTVEEIKKMTEAGMDKYLKKPLKMESLYEILYAYTNSPVIT
ncbi:response regulator [Sulfurimonas sp. CS5]|uniref:response regulator n=1 Tax=Sulfurimonas sp. CS5 TaxID=3391145 RepID=UPI0039ECE8A8